MIDSGSASKWRDDPDAETILKMVGVPYSVSEISFTQIDEVASANNCARMGDPINAEKVEEYEASMRRGDTFPRIVVEQSKKGLIVLGGNQRFSAAKKYAFSQPQNRLCSLEAYVVKPLTESHRQAVIRSLNSRHGWGTEKSERIEHAVYLVRSCGFLRDDAAKLMSVSTHGIDMRIKAEDTRHALGASGINSNKLPMCTLYALGRIKDEDIQKQVAKVAIAAEASGESVTAVATQIEAARSKAKKADIVKEWTKEIAYKNPETNGERKTVKTPRRDKFLRKLSDMVDFLDRGNDGSGYTSMDELQCTEANDGDTLRMLASKIVFRLKTITGV